MTETFNKEGSDMKSGVFPAFPTSNPYEGNGMSLRDWFASQMLPRIGMGWPNLENRNLLAKQAYEMADAMIEERNKK
jgi:hypothetical protein